MRLLYVLALTLTLLLTFSIFITGCGDDDDDDDNDADNDDDTIDDDDDDDTTPDDDTTDDDTIDDDTTDDDTTDDDTLDDDTLDDDLVDDDTDYESTRCVITSDPLGINPNLIDGDPVGTGDTITVYVFDDDTCAPLTGVDHNASVNGIATDANGMAQIEAVKGLQLISASADLHEAWSYMADADSMYFRLRPKDYGAVAVRYTETTGNFYSDDSLLALENMDGGLTDLASTTFYLGASIFGLSRGDIFSKDYNEGLFSHEEFLFSYSLLGSGEDLVFPSNLYLPDFNLNVLAGTLSASGVNETYSLPVQNGVDEFPLEGFVAAIDMTSIDITTIINTLISGGSLADLIIAALEPLVNTGISFPYVAVNPDYAGTGAADMDVYGEIRDIDISIANVDSEYLYAGLILDEIPNRALIPAGVGLADTAGEMTVSAAKIPSGDYMAMVGKSNIMDILDSLGTFVPLELSIAMRYTDNISDWSTGIAVDDSTDFLPMFDDAATSFDNDPLSPTAGLLTLGMEADVTVDLYYVIYVPSCSGTCPMVFATIPGTETQYQVPLEQFGIVPEEMDYVTVVAVDLPDATDLNACDPTSLFAENSAAFSVWMNVDIGALIEELM